MSQERVDTHSALQYELQAADLLLSWGSSVMSSALLKGKGVLPGKAAPSHLLQLIIQLCHLPDIWLDSTWRLLGVEPSSLLLDLEWNTLCVSLCWVCMYVFVSGSAFLV